MNKFVEENYKYNNMLIILEGLCDEICIIAYSNLSILIYIL